ATKENGTLWIIVDTFKRKGNVRTLPFDIADELKQVGWFFQDIIIWDKGRTLPWSKKGQLRNTFEYILFFTKSEKEFDYFIDEIKEPGDLKQWWVRFPERYNPKGKVPSNIWEYDIPTQGSWSGHEIDHFNPFPPELVERLILLSTSEGDVVLDPFAGTGTTLAQADVMDREYIGFELNEKYIDMFHSEVKQEVQEKWKKRQEEISERNKSQKRLEQQIKKLRCLKFPKSLIRRLVLDKEWEESDLHLNSIFALKNGDGKEEIEGDHKFLSLDLYIVINNGVDREELIEDIEYLVEKPPLSKFGIQSTIQIYDTETFEDEVEDLINKEELWLYSDGKVHKFDKEYSEEEWKEEIHQNKWKEMFRNGVPPIISNIKVNQEVPEGE
ncbi:MAG: site-specific DNA-methyltransferase, partial [Candidatus Paceibacteria bacterium]